MASQLKNAYELLLFLNCFYVVRYVIQEGLLYYRALHCEKRSYSVSGETQEGYSM